MLIQLTVRDYAVIDWLDLTLQPGMTVLTGETGAGKSILVGALGLVLGDRGDTGIIRDGSDSTEITAQFDLTHNAGAQQLLRDQSIGESAGEVLIRRVISTDGRSRAFVNNTPVTVQLLRDLGDLLVDIHGQHAHQSLVRSEVQRELLDEYGAYPEVLAAVRAAFQSWQEATSRLNSLAADKDEAELALLEYQVQELADLRLEPNEYEKLDEEHRRMANSRELLESVVRIIDCLQGEETSVSSGIHASTSELHRLSRIDPGLCSVGDLLNEAAIQISEAGSELKSYLERLESDPEHLQTVEQRLSRLHEMARKHNIAPRFLEARLTELQQQLSGIHNREETVKELRRQQTSALRCYETAAAELHECRQRTAIRLAAEITTRIRELGMPDASFDISVELQDLDSPRLLGRDQVEFLVNTNPGLAPRPLRKVASGGELSRISLAIQVTGSSDRGIPCLVFDEVDAGIGGGIAEIVGRLLHDLGRQRQVLCVTHLPQVASRGNHHFQVNKTTTGNSTRTEIRELKPGERIDEIARMLGGLKITVQSRKHAREMLAG